MLNGIKSDALHEKWFISRARAYKVYNEQAQAETEAGEEKRGSKKVKQRKKQPRITWKSVNDAIIKGIKRKNHHLHTKTQR